MADDDFFLKRDAVGEAGLSAMGEPVPREWGEGMVVDDVVGGVEDGAPGVGDVDDGDEEEDEDEKDKENNTNATPEDMDRYE